MSSEYHQIQWGFPDRVDYSRLDRMAENDHGLYHDALLTPRGLLAYNSVDTATAISSTTPVEIISVTPTIEKNRFLFVGFNAKRLRMSSATPSYVRLYLYIDSVASTYGYMWTTPVKDDTGSLTMGTGPSFMWPIWGLDPGSHTISIYGEVRDAARAVSLDADATAPMHLWVEDAGGMRNFV